jgi:PAS domain S-box-containing protein
VPRSPRATRPRDGSDRQSPDVAASGASEPARGSAGESERRLWDLLQNVHLIAINLDLDGRITYCNPFLSELTGWPCEELMGADWFERFYPDDVRAEERAFLDCLARADIDPHSESVIQGRDGRRHVISWNTTILRDRDGRVEGSTSIGEDITLRRRAEERLAAQLAVARALSEATSVEAVAPRLLRALGEPLGWHWGVLWQVDRELDRLRAVAVWSREGLAAPPFVSATAKLRPARGEGLPGAVWETAALHWLEDVATERPYLRRDEAIAAGLRSVVSFPAVSDGVVGVVEFLSTAHRPRDPGMEELFVALGNQIGQMIVRRETVMGLAQSEARMSAIVTSALDCIIGMDDRGRIIEFNPAAERVFGYGRGEVMGRELAEMLIPPTFRGPHRDGLARYLSTGQGPVMNHRTELNAMRADGSEFPVEVAIIRVDDEGAPTFIGYIRDITERRRADTELRRRAAEQAALRRVATLVAAEAPEDSIFAALCEEVGLLLDAHTANMVRYDGPDRATVVGGWSGPGASNIPVGTVVPLDGETLAVRVRRSGRPERIDDYDGIEGELAERLRGLGLRSSVSAPITVGAALWGVVTASTVRDEPLPAGAEERLGHFAELASQALANADARRQLAASRARIVHASDAERRRLERNLHDGAQQRLVSLALTLRLAEGAAARDPEESARLLADAHRELAESIQELRELARGLHPAVLSERGLAPALDILANRSPVPVAMDVAVPGRLPAPIEAAIYYVVSEGLTNVARYARASAVEVRIALDDGHAVASVADDGVGGADPAGGTGIQGLIDRVEALGGALRVESAAGAGTALRARIPVRER